MGAYWLAPARRCFSTSASSAGSGEKSGKPCDRLMAPHSVASLRHHGEDGGADLGEAGREAGGGDRHARRVWVGRGPHGKGQVAGLSSQVPPRLPFANGAHHGRPDDGVPPHPRAPLRARRAVLPARPSWSPGGPTSRSTAPPTATSTRRTQKLANALQRLGVKPGDRVATLGWNTSRHLEAYFAVPLVGAVLHTLNPRLSATDLAYIMNHADDQVLLVDDVLYPVFERFAHEVKPKHVIVWGHGGPAAAGTARLRAAHRAGAAAASPSRASTRTRRSGICYTSGTTGQPKGVVYSHRAVVLHSLASAMPDSLGLSQARRDDAGGAHVPRQRLGAPLRRGDDRQPSRSSRAAPRRGLAARAGGRGAGDLHRRRADDLARHPRRARQEPRRLRHLQRCRPWWSAARRRRRR